MTLRTNARIAGFVFLFYIVTGITAMILSKPVDNAEGIAAKLTSIAEHAPQLRFTIMLSFLMIGYPLILAVTIYALTRDQDRDLALLALSFRFCEGFLTAVGLFSDVGLLWLGTSAAGAVPDHETAIALGTWFVKLQGLHFIIGGWVFAVGSTLYSYLFLRARSISIWLAWLGVFASIVLVLVLPAQLVGWISGPVTFFIWLPMLVFEVVLGFWLIIKGVNPRFVEKLS